MSVNVKESRPSAPLDRYIELFWDGDFNIFNNGILSQKVVPTGFVELIIHLSGHRCDLYKDGVWGQSPDFTIIGLYTRPYEVIFKQRVRAFGVRFKPEGVYNIFGIPASEFHENFEDMEAALGKDFREFCLRLKDIGESGKRKQFTEEYLLKKAENNALSTGYLNRAADMIRETGGFASISEISEKSYISIRQLEREFKSKIGVNPKLYMRIARMNEAHRLMQSGSPQQFAQLAYDCGYSDQAHFIRDFKRFTGEKPKVFVKNSSEYMVANPV